MYIARPVLIRWANFKKNRFKHGTKFIHLETLLGQVVFDVFLKVRIKWSCIGTSIIEGSTLDNSF